MTEPTVRYSDEWLEWARSSSPSRGEQHAAPYLATIPFEHRLRAAGLAHAIMNRLAARYSDAVQLAVGELRASNFGETVTERQNREWLENHNADRNAIRRMQVEQINILGGK